MDESIKIVEVGPRDGLQNEKHHLTVPQRMALIEDLIQVGLRHIEVGSCVSPKWVPQMANSTELFQQLPKRNDVQFSLLTPNIKGFQAAQAVNCKEVAVFTAASQSFTHKNINCTIEESLENFSELIQLAKQQHILVRGYVSCMVDCPYEGAIDPQHVVKVVKALLDMGCYEVSLGETIGTATPDRIKKSGKHVWLKCPQISSLDIFIIPMAWPLPIFINRFYRVFVPLIHQLQVWVAALMPKVLLAMFRLKTCFIS